MSIDRQQETINRRFFLKGLAAAAAIATGGTGLLMPAPAAEASHRAPAVIIKRIPDFSELSGLGINIDLREVNCSADFLKALGAGWVRQVVRPGESFQSEIGELRNEGIRSLLVIEKESIKLPGVDPYDYEHLLSKEHLDNTAKFYAKNYPDVSFWQIGNEPDDNHGPSSWTLTQPLFNRLANSFRQTMPSRFLIAGGVSQGSPDFFKRVDLSKFDGIAFHPYGVHTPDFKAATDFTTAPELLERFSTLGLPVFATEVGVNHEQYKKKAAEYAESLLRYFAKHTQAAAQFCLSDSMVDHHGMFDKDGNSKDTLSAFLKVAYGNSHPDPGSFRLQPRVTPAITEKEFNADPFDSVINFSE